MDCKTMERTTPRPRCICEDCKAPLVLKWGDKRRMHWSHIGDKGLCTNSSPGETETHRLAKTMLVKFLNRGGMILFLNECEQCANETILKMPECATMFEEEFKSYNNDVNQKCVFDVAALTKDNTLCFGIEIWNTHKTTNVEPRNNVPWFEIKAVDVLYLLDRVNLVTEITLTNYRRQPRCNRCNLQFCLTRVEMAVKLGYLLTYDPYSCTARRLLDEAIRGKYKTVVNEWNVEGWQLGYGEKPSRELWQSFISKNRCMKCQKNHNVTFKKPFCLTCYKTVAFKNKNQNENQNYIYTSVERQNELRNQFSWLSKVPGNWRYGSPCFKCGYKYIKENEKLENFKDQRSIVYGYVWWFGDKKCCCDVCLDNIVHEGFPSKK